MTELELLEHIDPSQLDCQDWVEGKRWRRFKRKGGNHGPQTLRMDARKGRLSP